MFIMVLVARPANAYVKDDGKKPGGGPSLMRMNQYMHDVNAVFLMVSNQGPIGLDLESGNGTGFFPSNTSNNYVFGTGLWFGARYDADNDGALDKVFTQGYNPLAGDSEFREGRNDQDRDDSATRVFVSNDPSDNDQFTGHSNDFEEWPDQFRVWNDSTGQYEPFAFSDQDIVTTYTTKGKEFLTGPFQMPLEVNQRSLAFKTGLAAQSVFFILDIVNWGDDVMTDAWVGYDNDMDVGVSFSDDLTSFIRKRDMIETPEAGDSARVNMAYAWDSDFQEANFTGDPGLVGIAYRRSPGNPDNGIDNDGDGLVDESPYNGLDDDGNDKIDDPFEVDELGLVNFTKECNPAYPCEIMDPETDVDGYDILNCISATNPDSTSQFPCIESTTPADIRFVLSSGPFDWQPGQSQQVVIAMVFANAVGKPSEINFFGSPPRPDPNDPAFGELLAVKDVIQGVFDLNFLQASAPPAPNMSLIPGDGKVTILWDEKSVSAADRTYNDFVVLDSTYRQYDFEGYRVWRSRTGTFSRRGDVNSPDFPLTPEAMQENELVSGFDLDLLAQYDLADGLTTDSLGVVCSDSVVALDSSVVYTKCDTFNIGTDTGLQFSYVDRGTAGAPLINGFRYFYSVTAYDVNSPRLPVSRRSLDSGVSFPAENSVIPRSNASSFVDAFGSASLVDAARAPLASTGSIFADTTTGELFAPDSMRATNAMVGFEFNSGIPELVSDDYYTLVLDSFERTNDITNRITYSVEDSKGNKLNAGLSPVFSLPYNGTDTELGVTVFNPDNDEEVIFTSTFTFNVDTTFLLPPSILEEHLLGVELDSIAGSVSFSQYRPADYRATDIELRWESAGLGSLTVRVVDIDNNIEIPFGDGIVDSTGAVSDDAKGPNWSFLPVSGGAIQPGGRYFLTTAPVRIADMWVSGIRATLSFMAQMPDSGDVWTLRQLAEDVNVEIDTTVVSADSRIIDATYTYHDGPRPPVPGTRYEMNTASGGQDKGTSDMTKIRVVPNPYVATSAFELGPTQRQMQFINLPPECTIRIYTISGNLVQVLDHMPDEGGTEVYDLRTRFNLELASGNYYYHVTTPDGETHLGRFAVVQ